MAVGRAKDDLQRKILAAVMKCFCWLRPVDVCPPEFVELGMQGPAALSRISSTPGKPLHWGLTDNKQAFTSVEVPEEHRAWVAGPVVQAKHIPRNRWPTNKKCTVKSKLRPWYRRLAMGDAWSVFFLMWVQFALIQNALFREPKLQGFVFFSDRNLNT